MCWRVVGRRVCTPRARSSCTVLAAGRISWTAWSCTHSRWTGVWHSAGQFERTDGCQLRVCRTQECVGQRHPGAAGWWLGRLMPAWWLCCPCRRDSRRVDVLWACDVLTVTRVPGACVCTPAVIAPTPTAASDASHCVPCNKSLAATSTGWPVYVAAPSPAHWLLTGPVGRQHCGSRRRVDQR